MANLTTASYVKITVAVLLALCVFALAGLGSCTVANLGNAGQMFTDTATVSAKDVKNLDIDWAAGSVEVKQVKGGGDIEMKQTAIGWNESASSINWTLAGSTLKVNYGDWSGWFNWFSWPGSGTKNLVITIPEDSGLEFSSIDLDGTSGDYIFTGLNSDSFTANLASGKLNATNMELGDLKIGVASGTINVDGKVDGNITTEAASGDITVNTKEVLPKSIKADLASGIVTVTIPDNNGFAARIDKLSGSFITDFATSQNGTTHTYKNGDMAIDVDMASGTFRLNKAA